MTETTPKRFVRETHLPFGWERVIGRATPDDVVTRFSDGPGWFDVSIKPSDDGYVVEAVRGPKHPRQDEIDRPLRRQIAVPEIRVEHVAVGFMLCASQMDPFTNTFSRGYEVDDGDSA